MGWWFGLVAIIIAALIAMKQWIARDKKRWKEIKEQAIAESRELTEPTANEIANRTQSYQQFKNLERRLDHAVSQSTSATSQKAKANAERKAKILQEAIQMVEKRLVVWQFVPHLDLKVSGSILEYAYGAFTPAEHEELKNQLGGGDNEWIESDVRNIQIPPEELLNGLKRFREIVESDIGQNKKAIMINHLARQNPAFCDHFFDSESDLEPGDQIFVECLQSDGLPMACELYQEGYRTPEDSLRIDLDEFSKRTGIHPEVVEKIALYQEKIRKQTQKEEE